MRDILSDLERWQAIESFVSSFPRCRFIVTSRTYAYQNQDWKLNGFTEAVLAYENDQIYYLPSFMPQRFLLGNSG